MVTNNFLNLCYVFPSFTNVMTPIFGSKNYVATLARSEAYFKDLKQDETKPSNVKKFILKENKKSDSLVNYPFVHLPKEKAKIDDNRLKKMS